MNPTGLAVASAYDAIAPDYQRQLARNPVAVYMRAAVQSHLARIFRPGDCVLDFTAGTGEDACFLARRGLRVIALDASAGMVAELSRNAAAADLPIESRVLPADRLGELGRRDLDGAISTFGGLNTIDDLDQLAVNLATCVKPGGRALLHALNRRCLWESLSRHTLRGRSERPVMVGGISLVHRFYDPFDLWQQHFRTHFSLRTVYGLSVVAAPSWVARLPQTAQVLLRLDLIAGRVLPSAGDFFVVELERRDGRG